MTATPLRAVALTRTESLGESRGPASDALMAQVGLGDKAAFALLYDHLAAAAYGLAQRVVCNRALAEEITQDAFLQIWATGPSFDRTRGSARNWILTIVHRRAVDVVRHEQSSRARVLAIGAQSFEQPFDDVWAAALANAERDEVVLALSTLTAVQQEAIELSYYQGLTCAEVAQRLDIPVGTAKSRILEGVRRLRRVLADAPEAGQIRQICRADRAAMPKPTTTTTLAVTSGRPRAKSAVTV